MKQVKQTLMIGAALVLAGGTGTARASEKPAAKVAAKAIHCPIMKTNKVDVAKATKDKMFADYKGNRYFFCCAGCPEAFKKNPAKYAKGDHLPIAKKPKKG
jgi:YHS domain-containing protein